MNIFLFFKFANFFPMFADVLPRYPETMFPGPCRFFRRTDVCNTDSNGCPKVIVLRTPSNYSLPFTG